jgi:hypothetical protein
MTVIDPLAVDRARGNAGMIGASSGPLQSGQETDPHNPDIWTSRDQAVLYIVAHNTWNCRLSDSNTPNAMAPRDKVRRYL